MTFTESLADEVRNGACGILGNLANGIDYARSLVNPALGDVGGGGIVNTGRGILYAVPFINVARGLELLVCNRSTPLPPPPFTGGQCDGVPYLVNASADLSTSVCTSAGGVGQTQRVWGPVTSILPFNVEPCTRGQGPFTGQDLAQLWEIRCRGLVQPPAPPGPPGTIVQILAASRPNKPVSSFVVTVTRDDGQPDDCGDPSPVFPEPTPGYPNVTNNNFTFVDNSGNNITIPLALVYLRPTINVDGTVQIPVEIDVGGIKIDGTLNQDNSVDFNIGDSFRPTLPGPAPEDPAPIVPAPPVPPDTPTPEPPQIEIPNTRRAIVAVVVTTTNIDLTRASVINQDENPTIYVPRLGSINFLYQFGPKDAAWGADINVKNRRQVIPVEWPYGAIDVKGTPADGVTWELTPIFDKTRSFESVLT